MSVEPLKRPNQGARVPPHDLDAEASLLGAMLLSANALPQAVEIGLRASDFYRPAHGFVFDACVDLQTHGEPADPVTVADVLHRDGLLDTIGGPQFLVGLQAGTPAISNAGRYAQTVKDFANLRRLIAVAGEIAELGYSLPDDVNEAVARAAQMVEVVAEESGDHSSMWADVATLLEGELDLEPPSLGYRDDKACAFFYPGRVHLINGESEAGKSLLMAHLSLQIMEEGHDVWNIDWEDSAVGHLSRLRDMGASDSLLREKYHYSQRDTAWTAASRLELRRSLDLWKPALVIIDAMTPALATEGADDYRGIDVARFYSDIIRNCRNAGSAVAILDHVNKDNNASDFGTGSQYKKGGIDGVSYMLKKAQPMGRGLFGRSLLTIAKDRHGYLRGVAVEGKFLGVLEVDGTTPGKLGIKVVAPPNRPIGTVTEDGAKRFPAIMEAMSRVLEEAGAEGAGGASLKAVVRGKTTNKVAALHALVKEGYATWGKFNGKDVLLSVDAFRDSQPYAGEF